MIETESLCKQFDGFTAVDQVTLRLGKARCWRCLDPMARARPPQFGCSHLSFVRRAALREWQGFDIVHQAQQVRASVGVLTENHGLYTRMPADDYLDFFGQIYALNPDLKDRRVPIIFSSNLGSWSIPTAHWVNFPKVCARNWL